MKTFSQFLTEARTTLASQQARQMGLQGSGHGDWYDSQGNLVAKTVKGKLEVFRGRQKSQNTQDTGGGKATQQQEQPKPKQADAAQIQPEEAPPTSNGVVVVLGRFNPPGKAHEQLLNFGMARATENQFDFKVYPSRVEDGGSNPLNAKTKLEFMKIMYPKYADYILDNDKVKTVFDALSLLSQEGYRDVRLVVGAERLGEFQSLVHRNQGQGYEFENIEVMPASMKDPDSDNAGAGSSAALKIAASENNFDAFASSLPKTMKKEEREGLFTAVTKAMKIGENFEMWRILPERDYDNLRIQYKTNDLYPIGSLVENMNTGLSGRVIRRGANYLICVSENGEMFKSWLYEITIPCVSEEVYEVGTDKYREALQRMSAGEKVRSFTGVKIKETVPKNINKLRKALNSVK
jgi:hypothetical protein